MILLMLLSGFLFSPGRRIIIPKTGITEVRNVCTETGISLIIDGEWAFYQKISKDVFVRKALIDSLACADSILPAFFKFDLDGDGKFERITFNKNSLKIQNLKGKKETYKGVSSFAFYDTDNNGSPDLFYTDTSGTLHFLKNRHRIKNFAVVLSRDSFIIEYYTKRKKYPVTVYPWITRGIIPLYGWKKVVLRYKNSSITLSRGMVVNTEKLASPVENVSYESDTLKISINLSQKATYSINILGKDTLNIAKGTLPKGAYKFEYYVGPLKKGTYKVQLKLNKKDFYTEFPVK